MKKNKKKYNKYLFNLLIPYFECLDNLSVSEINLAISLLSVEEKEKLNKYINTVKKVSYKKLFIYISWLVDISLQKIKN